MAITDENLLSCEVTIVYYYFSTTVPCHTFFIEWHFMKSPFLSIIFFYFKTDKKSEKKLAKKYLLLNWQNSVKTSDKFNLVRHFSSGKTSSSLLKNSGDVWNYFYQINFSLQCKWRTNSPLIRFGYEWDVLKWSFCINSSLNSLKAWNHGSNWSLLLKMMNRL